MVDHTNPEPDSPTPDPSEHDEFPLPPEPELNDPLPVTVEPRFDHPLYPDTVSGVFDEPYVAPIYGEDREPPAAGPTPGAIVGIAVAAAVLGAALLAVVLYVAGVFDSDSGPEAVAASPATVIETREIITEGTALAPATSVARKVVPSIVTVEVGNGGGSFNPIASGSGVVVTEDGYIITNHHVIDGTSQARVIFEDGRIYDAAVVGSDILTDLAVLDIDAAGLVALEKGTTADLSIGDATIAVGNPLGLRGGPSLTAGVLSAFNREVQVGPQESLFGMLQTDAPITEGSSGGALVDHQGRLIGITTAIGVSSAGAEGIGFAIPVELVTRITDEIIATGDVSHAFLGVQLQDSFEDQPDGSSIPVGALIAAAPEDGTAADTAGLRSGDLIVRYDDVTVRNRDDLIIGLRQYRVGDALELEIVRDSETIVLPVTLGIRPDGG